MTELPYPRIACGPEAVFEIDEELALGEVTAMIAKPFSPGNAFPAEEVARERITFDKAMIGSCTNGSYDDLLSAALVLVAARGQGLTRAQKEFVVFPGSGGVKMQIERPDPRLGGESIADVFRSVGGQIRASWCGPCFGQGPDALANGQRAITSFNRNWQNRMGYGGEGYLASPSVVAASALAGYMAPPSELGLSGTQKDTVFRTVNLVIWRLVKAPQIIGNEGTNPSVEGDGNVRQHLDPVRQILAARQQDRIKEDRRVRVHRFQGHQIQHPRTTAKLQPDPIDQQHEVAVAETQRSWRGDEGAQGLPEAMGDRLRRDAAMTPTRVLQHLLLPQHTRYPRLPTPIRRTPAAFRSDPPGSSTLRALAPTRPKAHHARLTTRRFACHELIHRNHHRWQPGNPWRRRRLALLIAVAINRIVNLIW